MNSDEFEEPLPSFREQWSKVKDVNIDEDQVTRRLLVDIDLFIQISFPGGVPSLLLETSTPLSPSADDLASTIQVDLTCEPNIKSGSSIQLQLKDSQFIDLFLNICDDIVPKITDSKSDVEAASILLRRFRTWRHFLKTIRKNGLTPQAQLGLYGELLTIEYLLSLSIEPTDVVNAWTGPDMAEQDFQLNGSAIEVKTIVHSEPQKIPIHGERQLDEDCFTALVLTHHKLHRQQDSGETLLQRVALITELLQESTSALELFDDKLLLAGYARHDEHLYAATGYGVKQTLHYRVAKGFPRLTESDLPSGLGKLEYVIDASACVPFIVEESQVAYWLTTP